jgi:hypothetical protein
MSNKELNGKEAIPERLFKILRTCGRDGEPGNFPPTEVFNEGWMLRLVLDTIRTLNLQEHALTFLKGSRWYSEALLSSPFRPRLRQDPLGEGFTNADAVIGHFDFRPSTKTGLTLAPDAKQFVVAEAKMFSNLSSGTKNAPMYNQAARNVACMANAIAKSGIPLSNLESVGFFIIAPQSAKRTHRNTNLEGCLTPSSIRLAVTQRIAAYDNAQRKEVNELRQWEKDYFLPLVDRLMSEERVAVLSWEKIIDVIAAANSNHGEELAQFYKRCLTFAPTRE